VRPAPPTWKLPWAVDGEESSLAKDAIEEPFGGQWIVFRQRSLESVAGDLFVRPGRPMHGQ
jgi:hypothetical protein